MIIFFTILFLVYYILAFMRGNLFHKLANEIGEEEIKKQKLGIDNYKPSDEFTIKILLLGLFVFIILILQVIYYCFALPVDTLKYPTLALLIFTILNIVFAFIKSKSQKKIDLSSDEKVEKYRKKLKKKRSFKSTLYQLLYIVYFGYMFYILVF